MTKKVALWVLAIVIFIVVLESPQGMIFPLWIIGYMYREYLSRAFQRFSPAIVFIGLAWLLGMVTELFAIWEQSVRDIAIRTSDVPLLHPDPLTDLLFGAPYYFFYALTLWFWIRKYALSSGVIFLSTGLFGLLTEQGALYLVMLFANPVFGIPMAFIIMSVYAVFPLIAYYAVEQRLGSLRSMRWWQYLLIPGSLLLFWALYGLFVYDTLIQFFPKDLS